MSTSWLCRLGLDVCGRSASIWREEENRLNPPVQTATLPPPPMVQVINANEGNKEKAPKKLGQGVWQRQIAAYEDAQSPPRLFPQKMIAGADEVLARMMWEHETTKVYSELGLGEILATRMYNSCGQVNKFRHKHKGKDVLGLKYVGGDEVEVVKKDERGWNPRSGDLIRDALEANKWAYIFAGYAEETIADKWIDQFKQNLRARCEPDRCRDLYEATTIKLTVEMLSGYSFQEATEWIITDRAWWTEFNQEWRGQTAKRKWPDREPDTTGKGERFGSRPFQPKVGGKGKWPGTCNDYNAGWCARGQAACYFVHICSLCGGAHKASGNLCGGKRGRKGYKNDMRGKGKGAQIGKGKEENRKTGKGSWKR